jgi:hypothetical protein
MLKEPRGIATQHTTSSEAVMLHPAEASRKATPSSDKEVPSDITAHCAQVAAKGGNKRCMQRPQGTTTTTSHDDGNDWEAGGSGVGRISTTARSDKRMGRLPMDHFKRLLEEACPNHKYPVRHKLKDYNMMRIFMTSGSLT